MKFNWVEGTTTVKEIVRALATDLTLATANKWSLVYPSSLSSIDSRAVIKTVTSKGQDFFVELERPVGVLSYIKITLGIKYDPTSDGIDAEIRSESARYAWYRESNEVEIFEWTAVQYWLSFTEDFINMVVQGDPSLDVEPYRNYLISYAYVGALESFEGADEDDKYNFGLTVSSDVFPGFTEDSEKYGKRTATCVTDIGMIGTRTGTPFQAHLPKFSTAWEFSDRNFIAPSQWTHKYHMSDIIVWHAYDRERGKLQNVLIGDRSAIFHLDTLVIDRGLATEKQYVMFNINAPYGILNNGPNVLYGIALRKS
jgi:hypothetical protein